MTNQQMQLLSRDQIRRAVEVMQAYMAAPKNPDGQTPMEVEAECDQ
jgi:hypothetical protein